MAAYNPPGPSAYAPNPVNTTTNAPIVDANDNIIPSTAIPDLAPPLASSGGYQSSPIQVLSAILVELRVLTRAMQQNISTNLDINAMRADEASSANGGAIN